VELEGSRENRSLPLPTDRRARTGCCGDADKHPRDIADHVENHHEVVDVVVIAGGDVHPASTGESAHNARQKDDSGKRGGFRMVQEVLEEYNGETWACVSE